MEASGASDRWTDADHLRAALKYVTHRDSRALVADLKKIYQARSVVEAEQELTAFAEKWAEK